MMAATGKRMIGYWAGALIVFPLMFSGCSPKGEAENGKPSGPPAVNVVAIQTEQRDFSEEIFVVGTLQADETVTIVSEVGGVIESIHFEEGQHVSRGDVLFQIEKKKLQAAYDQALANLKLAETTAQRYETLVKTKAVSQQEYDEVAAALASNLASVALAKEQLDDATLQAPFNGMMGERLISVGQFVAQGTRLSSLYSQDPIKVEFHLPERYLGDVRVGQKVEMRVAAYQDRMFEGEVYFIDPRIDDVTRTALVKAKVPNPKGELLDGMFANVQLIVRVEDDAILVPETALIVKADDVFVYVIGEDDTVSMQSVRVGKRLDGQAVIREGLTSGDVVVIEGYQKIGPGSKVNARIEDPSAKKSYETF